jgi:hypothetical protein
MKQERLFRECRLSFLEKTFGLVQVKMLPSLNDWLSMPQSVSERQKETLLDLQELLDFNVRSWNEQELDRYFIGPVLSMINFSNLKFNLYSERIVEAMVNDWRLYGRPDCFLASGRREPEIPYFAFQEYKKMTDPDGDPAGQALAAMLAAQALNEDGLPMYGCHFIGGDWYFMTLEGKEYTISRDYSTLTNEIFDVFKILKALKSIVTERVG